MTEKPNWLVGAVAAVVVVVVIFVVMVVTRGGGEGTVEVESIPGDLRLTLDGRQIPQNGQTKIKAGDHKLTASKPGFADQTESFRLRKDELARFAFFLDPNGPEGREWYRTHPNEAQEKEGQSSRDASDNGRKLAARYPIIQQLPYLGDGFRIDYGSSKAHPGDTTRIALFVTYFGPQGQKRFGEWMQAYKFRPADYEIIYRTS